MKFSRRLSSPPTSLPRIERELRGRDFQWSAILSAPDADQLSWHSVHLESEGEEHRLHFKYNWPLQALAQLLLSAFILAFANRYELPSMVAAPLLFWANAFFLVVSVMIAIEHADRYARNLARI